MCSRPQSTDWSQQRFTTHHGNVSTRITSSTYTLPFFTLIHLSFRLLLGFLGQLHPFTLFDRVKSIRSQMHLEHRRSLIHARQRYIDTLLEPTRQTQSMSSDSVNLQAYRLRIAVSSAHGIFVAARTRTPALSVPTPTSMFIPYKDTTSNDPRTLHLHEKLGFDSSRRFGLGVIALAAHGINLIDEDNARLSLTGQFE